MRTGKKLSTVVSAFAVASALIPALPAAAATTAAEGTFVKIGHSGKCLNVQSASTANSAKIVQYPCSATATNDKFVLVPKPQPSQFRAYQIKAPFSGKCLNVQGGSRAAKTPVIQYTCSDTALNNLWFVEELPGSPGVLPSYRLRALHSDQCLNLPNGSTDSNVQLIQYPCSGLNFGTANELFYFPPATSANPDALPITPKQPVAVLQTPSRRAGKPGPLTYAWNGDPQGVGDGVQQLLTENDPDPQTPDPSNPVYVVDESLSYAGRPYLATQADGAAQVVGLSAGSGDAVVASDDTGELGGFWFRGNNIGGASADQPVVYPLTKGGNPATFKIINGTLWYAPQFPNNLQIAYAAWRSLGGSGLTGVPAFSPTAAGVRIYARSTTGSLLTAELIGRTLSDWTSLGGSNILGTPSVVVNPVTGRAHVFVRSGAGIQFTVQSADGTFGGSWTTIPGAQPMGSPSAVIDRDDQAAFVAFRGSGKSVRVAFESTPGSGNFDTIGFLSDDAEPETLAANDPTAFTFDGNDGRNELGFAWPSDAADRDLPMVMKFTDETLAKARKAGGKVLHGTTVDFGKLKPSQAKAAR
jgi:hypothetical protein